MKTDFNEIGCYVVDCNQLVQNRIQRYVLVNLKTFVKVGECLEQLSH
jgi:hypothetical protein